METDEILSNYFFTLRAVLPKPNSLLSFTDKLQNDLEERKLMLCKRYYSITDKGIYHPTRYKCYKGNYFIKKDLAKSIIRNRNISLFDKMVNLTMKAGLRQKSYLTLVNVFTQIIYILKFELDTEAIKYISSRYVNFILTRNLKFNSALDANELLAELVMDTAPLFTLKTQIAKKSKKKITQKYTVHTAYLKPLSRHLTTLK